MTARKIQKFLNESENLNISARTVSRRLNDIGLKKFKPKFVPKITDNQKKERVLFARKHRKTNWNTVIFSDESTFQLDHNAHTVWAKNQSEAVVPKCKYSKKVMIWGAFSAKGLSRLCFVEKILNSVKYQDILKNYLKPFMTRKHGNSECIFQQDNAPCHTSRSTKDFMRSKRIYPMNWPANSADLNPIENIWGNMKVQIAQRNPRNVDELKQFIEEEWNSTSKTTIRNLIISMKKRMNQVIAKKGEKIKY